MLMSPKLKNSSKSRRPPIDGPFDSAIVTKAEKTVAAYRMTMRNTDDGWFGQGVELPGAMGDGKTPDRCVESITEAMMAVACSMLEDGQSLPNPESKGEKIVKIDLKLLRGEKSFFENAARRRDQSLSEFIRSAALAQAHATNGTGR